jgi:hypothetical protein
MNRLCVPSAIPLLSLARVGIQGKVGNISVMIVAISDINNSDYNNIMHSDERGYGVYSFFQFWYLIAFFANARISCPLVMMGVRLKKSHER